MPESEREHRKGEQAGDSNAKGENFLSGIQSRPTFPKERWRQLSLIYMGGYTVGVAVRSVKPLSSTRMVRLHLRPPFYKKKFEKIPKIFL